MQIRFQRTTLVPAARAGPPVVAKLIKWKHRLPRPVPWNCSLVVTTMVSYYGGLHFPLSYSGLSIVKTFLHEPSLATVPQFKALCLLVIQSIELFGTVWLIESNVKSGICFRRLVIDNRGVWLVMSAIAIVAAFLSTSVGGICLPDDDALKQLVLCGGVPGLCATLTVYCIVTPMLEEFVYRGFVLTSLAGYMPLENAIGLSSVLFSVSHLNNLNDPSACIALFLIGSVLASAYAWTGNLAAPVALHSFYNFLVLLLAAFT